VQCDGESLRYASSRLRDDPDIVLVAVKQDSDALRYASTRLQAQWNIL
jgi:hypothetical protein